MEGIDRVGSWLGFGCLVLPPVVGVWKGPGFLVGVGRWHVVGFWDFRHECVVGVAIDGARVLAPVWGGCSGVCLLFENCIVDASIFVDFVDRFVW